MVMAADNDNALNDANRLFASRSVMAQAAPEQRRINIAELVRFLSDPKSELPMDVQRDLFANPRLRADFQKLKQRLRLIELPALAAASAAGVTSRTFEGGTVRIHPSRVEGQVYVVFQFQEAISIPSALLL